MSDLVIHPATLDDKSLLKECDVRRLRRSGPGGQHRNKVETAIALRHRPTGIEAEANERRSQAQNQRVALFRLKVNLALNVRTEIKPAQTPNDLWKSRCRNRRISINPTHADFPGILAHAIDVFSFQQWDVKAAAEMLDCTGSQLIKLLKEEPRALSLVNDKRTELDLHLLK